MTKLTTQTVILAAILTLMGHTAIADDFNLKYEHPLRGHLRPDLYGSIYAVALPGAEEVVTRGIMFFDARRDLVFGVFMSGEALRPSPGEIEKFDAVMELVRALPSVCLAPG